MISNMKLHLPLYHLKEHFLPGTNSVRKIMEINPTYKENVKRLTFTWRRQSATDKRRENRGNVVTLAVHVSRKRGVKSL